MWVKDVDGDFYNIETGISIRRGGGMVGLYDFPEGIGTYLHNGTTEEAKEYMTELEKELAVFGKLVRVELPVDSEKCTCGKGLDIEPPDHDPKCSFFVPF